MRRSFLTTVLIAGLLACTIATTPAEAQLLTQHIKGTTGLKGGSQPPPHTYFVGPLIYVYNTDDVRNRDGERLPIDASITSVAYGIGILWVTQKKILGGNYGLEVLFPIGANNRIQGTEIDANPGAGLTDSVIAPIQLGWHFKRADATAGYSIYVPTGRYEDGANDNTGFGMWGHELSFGTTVYFNDAKQYHSASVVRFNFQSKKEDSETKVGNAMNIEGGVGADFLKGGLSTGMVYYWSGKLTEDRIEGIPTNLPIAKSRVFALGPEVQLALARKGKLFGSVKVNYLWETYARTATKGTAFIVLATFLLPPVELPK